MIAPWENSDGNSILGVRTTVQNVRPSSLSPRLIKQIHIDGGWKRHVHLGNHDPKVIRQVYICNSVQCPMPDDNGGYAMCTMYNMFSD